jgi:hypothetical protein
MNGRSTLLLHRAVVDLAEHAMSKATNTGTSFVVFTVLLTFEVLTATIGWDRNAPIFIILASIIILVINAGVYRRRLLASYREIPKVYP